MKHRLSVGIPILVLTTVFSMNLCKNEETVSVFAAEPLTQSSLKSKMDIDLKPTSESSVRSYYSNLNSLSESERKGTNLLKNLKPILRNNFEFYSYDNVWKIYEITDRDWTLSPAENIACGTYNANTQTISNYEFKKEDPYVHAYYRDHTSTDSSIIEDSKITAWSDHNASGINREHIWPQSHGFKAESGAAGPAGTDVHHLAAADGYVNQSIHNNDPYGYVSEDSTTKKGNRPSTVNNKVGKPKNATGAQNNTVFEPQDQDKGDIARACFYMVAMYNNLANESGVISTYDANLTLVGYATKASDSEWGTDTTAIPLGNLNDLLEWNKLDPVDEYEIHRNDLIYNNFQHNRNPFIDFPDWADAIWGSGELKAANPASDEIYKGSGELPPKQDDSDDPSKDTPTNPEAPSIPKEYLIIGVIVIAVIVIVAIIIYANGSKKTKKKMEKGAKKIAKKVGIPIPKVTSSSKTSSSKKSSSKSSKKK